MITKGMKLPKGRGKGDREGKEVKKYEKRENVSRK